MNNNMSNTSSKKGQKPAYLVAFQSPYPVENRDDLVPLAPSEVRSMLNLPESEDLRQPIVGAAWQGTNSKGQHVLNLSLDWGNKEGQNGSRGAFMLSEAMKASGRSPMLSFIPVNESEQSGSWLDAGRCAGNQNWSVVALHESLNRNGEVQTFWPEVGQAYGKDDGGVNIVLHSIPFASQNGKVVLAIIGNKPKTAREPVAAVVVKKTAAAAPVAQEAVPNPVAAYEESKPLEPAKAVTKKATKTRSAGQVKV